MIHLSSRSVNNSHSENSHSSSLLILSPEFPLVSLDFIVWFVVSLMSVEDEIKLESFSNFA